MKFKVCSFALATVAIVSLSSPYAHASVINMESLPSGVCAFANGGSGSATTQGFIFTTLTSGDSLYSCNGSVLSQDTTRSLVDANGRSDILMTAADSSAFSVTSFGSGTRAIGTNIVDTVQGSTGIQVIGTLEGGGTVTDTIAFNALAYQIFSLPGTFTNLASIEFKALGPEREAEFVLDDITVNPAAVPGPTVGAGASSFALAALFLGWLVRRRGHQMV